LALIRVHLGDAPALDGEALGAHALHDLDAALARAGRDRLARAGRIDLAVGGDIGRAHDAFERHDGKQLLGLLGTQKVHVEAEALGQRGGALVLLHARRGGGDAETPPFLPVDGHAGLGFEGVVDRDRLLQHARQVPRGAELADDAGGVPGGALGETALLDQQHVFLAPAREVVGDAAADDAAADDDDLRALRHDRFSPVLVCARGSRRTIASRGLAERTMHPLFGAASAVRLR